MSLISYKNSLFGGNHKILHSIFYLLNYDLVVWRIMVNFALITRLDGSLTTEG